MENPQASLYVEECCFCNELRGGALPAKYRCHYPVEKRLCLQTDHFVVLPSIAPLCEGHLLILPRDHFTCLVGMKEGLVNEFEAVLNRVFNAVKDAYGSVFVFEHGVVRVTDQACGVNHAHLHILPVDHVNAAAVERNVVQGFPEFVERSFGSVIAQERPKHAYLIYGADLLRIRMSLSDGIPSQFMRKTVGETIDNLDWDWRHLAGRASFLATIGRFSSL